LPQYS